MLLESSLMRSKLDEEEYNLELNAFYFYNLSLSLS